MASAGKSGSPRAHYLTASGSAQLRDFTLLTATVCPGVTQVQLAVLFSLLLARYSVMGFRGITAVVCFRQAGTLYRWP